jgi:hypothetical protein
MRKALIVIFIVIIQLILNSYINLGLYIYLVIFPFIILTLPYRVKTIPAMLLSFILGLAIDFLSNGVLGLNAGALTAMALCRQSFLQMLINEQSMGKYDTPSIKEIGFLKFSTYIILSFIIFFVSYIFLDNMGFSPFGFNLLKLLVSTLVNSFLMIIICIVTQGGK